MQVKNKLYPYPVLNDNLINSTFFNKCFQLCFDSEKTKEELKLNNIHFETNSKYIMDLYDAGLIGVVCIVECSYTVFRKCYPLTNSLGRAIVLKSDDFNGKVEISMFAYAKKDFSISSDEFLDDYKGITFQIDKYDVLAVNDGVTVKFDHLDTDDNVVRSIFNIVVDENLKPSDAYYAFYEGKKIIIYLPREQYENYSIVFNSTNFKEVFFNMLLVPVLAEIFSTIKRSLSDEDYDLDDVCGDYAWFYSVKNGYKKTFSTELTKESFLDIPSVTLAQELLGKPFGPSLVNIIEVIRENKEENANE